MKTGVSIAALMEGADTGVIDVPDVVVLKEALVGIMDCQTLLIHSVEDVIDQFQLISRVRQILRTPDVVPVSGVAFDHGRAF